MLCPAPREASGGNFLARAWRIWGAQARTGAAGDAGGTADQLTPVDAAGTHGTMRTGDRERHLQATREWVALCETAAYRQRIGTEATRALRSASVLKTIQRCRFSAPVARDQTGCLLRQVRGGIEVVVTMGTARVRGRDGWMRRYLRRLCGFVNQNEFNTSEACPHCRDRLVLIYPTGNSPPRLLFELYGPPVCAPAPARRVRMADGSRRGQHMRPLPSASHKPSRGFEFDTSSAAVRSRARAAAEARRSAPLAVCAVEVCAFHSDPSCLSEWAVKGCTTGCFATQGTGHPVRHPVLHNPEVVAAFNLACVTARRLIYTNVWPFKRPHSLRWSQTNKCQPNAAPVSPRHRARATTRVSVWPVVASTDALDDCGGGFDNGGGCVDDGAGGSSGCIGGVEVAGGDSGWGRQSSTTSQPKTPRVDWMVPVESATDRARRMEAAAAHAPRGLVDTARG